MYLDPPLWDDRERGAGSGPLEEDDINAQEEEDGKAERTEDVQRAGDDIDDGGAADEADESLDSNYLRHRLPGLFHALGSSSSDQRRVSSDQRRVIDHIRNELPAILHFLLPLPFHGDEGMEMLSRAHIPLHSELLSTDEADVPRNAQMLSVRLRERGLDVGCGSASLLDCLYTALQDGSSGVGSSVLRAQPQQVKTAGKEFRKSVYDLLQRFKLEEHLTTVSRPLCSQSDHLCLLVAELEQRNFRLSVAAALTCLSSPSPQTRR